MQSTFARTEGMWVSPTACAGQFPEDLIEALLDPNLPFQAIKRNPEKARLLTAISLPSRSWFYQYLRWFEHQPEHGKKIVSARHGVAEWEREQLVFDTYVSRATMPLQYVFADHWLIDLFTVDEATRSQINRLWLTLLIDAYSRSVLGMALLYEAPCLESIQLALRHAIWPKTSHQALGLEGEWVCYGIPQHLSLDNAWAHHAPNLRNLTRVISQGGRYNPIELMFRPPYKGRYGALIERLFGNFSGQMKELFPGAIRGQEPQERRRAAQEACLLYQDVYALIQQMILTYQHTPHHELGQLTPHQKWVEGLEFTPLLVPPLTETLERQFWRTYPQTRTITSKGIALFGMHYWSSTLNHIARRGTDGKPIHFRLSYEPADIRRLALFAQDQWLGDVYAKELRLPDGSTRSLSLWECQLAKDLARMQEQTSRDWLRYIDQIDKLTQNRFAERKKGQRLSKGLTMLPTDAGIEGTRSSARFDPQSLEEALEEARLNGEQPDYTALLVDFVSPNDVGPNTAGRAVT